MLLSFCLKTPVTEVFFWLWPILNLSRRWLNLLTRWIVGYKICFLYNVTIHPSHSTNQESGADTLRMEELIGLLQSLLYKISNLNSNHGILMNLGFLRSHGVYPHCCSQEVRCQFGCLTIMARIWLGFCFWCLQVISFGLPEMSQRL